MNPRFVPDGEMRLRSSAEYLAVSSDQFDRRVQRPTHGGGLYAVGQQIPGACAACPNTVRALEHFQPHVDWTASRSQSLLDRLGRRQWNVRIQEGYEHGVSVAVDDAGVVFRYLDHLTGAERQLRLPGEDFLIRWFEHVPARGLYASKRRQIRQTEPAREPTVRTAAVTALDPERCPVCHTLAVAYELDRPVRAWPPVSTSLTASSTMC